MVSAGERIKQNTVTFDVAFNQSSKYNLWSALSDSDAQGDWNKINNAQNEDQLRQAFKETALLQKSIDAWIVLCNDPQPSENDFVEFLQKNGQPNFQVDPDSSNERMELIRQAHATVRKYFK